jgi:predicted small integral membrane protein
MRHWHHISICLGLAAVALALVAIGAGAFAFIAPLGCVLMMGMMIWMMVRPGGHGRGGNA